MTELHILIVEDDLGSAINLEILLEELSYSNVTITKSAKEALKVVSQSKPDLILLDIGLEGRMDGILIAEQIKAEKIPVIFTTAFSNDLIYNQAKATEPYAYLTKPINKIMLESTIESAVRYLRLDHSIQSQKKSEILDISDEIFIKAANKLVKLNISDILAIEAEGNYCTFYALGKKLVVKMSLAKIKEKLGAALFFQIHRNYIIQFSKINSVSLMTDEVLIGKYRFPIGGKYRSEFLAQLKKL